MKLKRKKNKMKKLILSLIYCVLMLGCGDSNPSSEQQQQGSDAIQTVDNDVGEYNNLDNEEYLNFRNQPQSDAEIIRQIPKGEKFIILESTNEDWTKIKTIKNEIGFVKTNRTSLGSKSISETQINPSTTLSEVKPTVSVEKIKNPKTEQTINFNEAIVGSWVNILDERKESTLSFNKDGTGKVSLNNIQGDCYSVFAWEVKGKVLKQQFGSMTCPANPLFIQVHNQSVRGTERNDIKLEFKGDDKMIFIGDSTITYKRLGNRPIG
jgi:hypothetical protein